MENRFATPRIDSFPAGLRVLVVDDDPTWLKILEKMLKRCSYEVTTCFLARDALGMLRERKGGFDIVISDVNMPDMDGFKLLEHVGLEMNLPVIMMSVDGETSRVMKGVQHGACDYLLKPVRMKELQNIWQHVFRKKLHEVKDIESHECNEDIQKISNRLDKFDDGLLVTRSDLISTKKRKDTENQEYDDHDFSDSSAAKKARVVWSVDLHQKFVNAVDQIGFDKAGPKKILDLMNVPWLTRENVASHLQKYRLYWSRMQKQNEPKTSSGAIKQQDFTSKDPPPSFGLQSSITMHQNDSTSCSFGFSGSKIPVPSFSPEIQENDLESIVTFLPVSESKPALTDDGPYPQKVSSGSGMSLTNSFGSLRPDVSYTSFVSNIPQNNSWGGEILMMQFPQQPKEEPKTNGFVHLVLPGTHHDIQADKAAPSEIKPPYNESKSNHVRDLSSTGSTIDLFSVQAKIDIVNPEAFGDRSTITQSMNLKNHSFDQNFIRNWESHEQPRSGPPLVSSREALQLCSLQDYGYIENIGLNNLESLGYHDLEYITEFPSHVYDGLSFNSDSLCVSMEYPIMDQGLFIA